MATLTTPGPAIYDTPPEMTASMPMRSSMPLMASVVSPQQTATINKRSSMALVADTLILFSQGGTPVPTKGQLWPRGDG